MLLVKCPPFGVRINIKKKHQKTIAIRNTATGILATLAIGLFLSTKWALDNRKEALSQLSNSYVERGFRFADSQNNTDAMLMFIKAMEIEPNRDRRVNVHRWRIGTWADRLAEVSKSFLHESNVVSVFSAKDGRHLLTATDNGKAQIWDNFKSRSKPSIITFNTALRTAALAFNSDKGFIGIGNGNQIEIWNITAVKREYGPFQDEGKVVCLCFSPDGRYVISISKNDVDSTATCRIWEIATGKSRILERSEDVDNIHALQVSPDGSLLLGYNLTAIDSIVRIWDIAKSKTQLSPNFHKDSVRFITINSKGAIILYCQGR